MLYVYLGTDRKKARDAMNAAIKRSGKDTALIQITDAHATADLDAAFAGRGLFDDKRSVVLDGVFANEEMRGRVIEGLASMKDSGDAFFLFEEKLDAPTKRSVAKYAEEVQTFDAAKKAQDNGIFALRFALEKGDKKALWVGLMREYAAGKAPEAVHGFLFWAAKQMVLSTRSSTSDRARSLLARLAELPHESRRKGEELEYALERFVLSEV
jgi:hypothetical protein